MGKCFTAGLYEVRVLLVNMDCKIELGTQWNYGQHTVRQDGCKAAGRLYMVGQRGKAEWPQGLPIVSRLMASSLSSSDISKMTSHSLYPTYRPTQYLGQVSWCTNWQAAVRAMKGCWAMFHSIWIKGGI